MKVLGLSYGFHDSSAALIMDGKLVASSREENHTRQKHDSFFPQFAIESCLRKAGICMADIDKVSFYENTEKKWTRVLSSSLNQWPLSHREFTTSMKSWLGGKLWTEAILKQKLNLQDGDFSSFTHHQSHAAQAFIGSEFQEAAILTVDAVGEWETCSQYFAKWVDGRPVFTKLSSSKYPNSLGLFYSAITDYLGFKPMSDECSTMALSAFGSDKYLDKMRECIEINDSGEVLINDRYFKFDRYFTKPYTSLFIKEFGCPAKEKYGFNSLEKYDPSSDEIRLSSIAYAAQKVFEECMIKLTKNLFNITQTSNICLAGGAALNCVSNSKLINKSNFKKLFIPKDPGDGGASTGAAFLCYFEDQKTEKPVKASPISHGETHIDNDFASVVKKINPSKLQKHKKIDATKNFKEKWVVKEFVDSYELIDETSNQIASGNVVGWFQKGVESGPRALGYRSILFKADDLDLVAKVSCFIKNRAKFRPYALSMTDKTANKILDIDNINHKPLRYMQFAVNINDDYISKVRGGLHADLTTRPQVVFRDENPLYYDLLEAYGRTNDLAAFINTSFNESSYPIVETPYDALLMFARTDLDFLVVNNVIVKKVRE